MKKFLIPIALFALLGLLFAVAIYKMKSGTYSPRNIPSPLIGKPLPDFALPALDDPKKIVRNKDLLGKVTLINFWGSWCVTCRQEHPVLMDLSRTRQVPLIGLNHKDQRDAALAMLRTDGNPYDFSLFDPEGRTGIDWGVYGVPETFVVDRNGIIRYKHVGPITPETWEKTLLPIIKQLST